MKVINDSNLVVINDVTCECSCSERIMNKVFGRVVRF